MTSRVTGTKPDCIGDLPSFTITYTPPAASPAAVPTAVTVSAIKPDGTVVTGSSAAGSGLSWTWTATTAIDQAGTWQWRIVATGALIDATELAVRIPVSAFT